MISFLAHWLPKHGTAVSDWEDGCAYSSATGWFAVTDGASTGLHSRSWAYTLASRFVADRRTDLLDPSGAEAFAAWLGAVRSGFDPDSGEFPPLAVPAWVRQAGQQQGAFATFLGGRISEGKCTLLAVGDCCAFHVAGDGTWTSFPLSLGSEFGSTPDLVASAPRPVGAGEPDTLRHGEARWDVGDRLFVATDALSEWVLKRDVGPHFWDALDRMDSRQFYAFCQAERRSGAMRNDDVTMLRCRAAPREVPR